MAPTDLAPIFVVGVPRSGTTLLAAMLNAHPRIAITPETFFLEWALRDRTADLSNEATLRDFWRRFTGSAPFADLGLDADSVLQGFLRSGGRTFPALLQAILRAYAAAQDKPRAGEKTPRHYLYIETLLRWFPRSRVAFVVRDPRAVAASLVRVPWASDDVEVHAWRWKQAIDLLSRFEEDSRVLATRYEELIADPRTELRRICAFVEEPFDEGMMEFNTGAAALVGNEAHKRGVLEPLSDDPLHKWKTALAADQVALIEHIAAAGMAGRGYAPQEDSLGWSNRIAVQARRITRRAGRARRRFAGTGSTPW